MEKLKKSIVQAHEDFEQEKQKNIEILNLIFPSDIAKQLWRGYFLTFLFLLLSKLFIIQRF